MQSDGCFTHWLAYKSEAANVARICCWTFMQMSKCWLMGHNIWFRAAIYNDVGNWISRKSLYKLDDFWQRQTSVLSVSVTHWLWFLYARWCTGTKLLHKCACMHACVCVCGGAVLLCMCFTRSVWPFSRPVPQQSQFSESSSPNMKRISSVLESSTENKEPVLLGQTQKRASTGSMVLNLTPTQSEPLLVHAGAVISMLHLIPAIYLPTSPQVSTDRALMS